MMEYSVAEQGLVSYSPRQLEEMGGNEVTPCDPSLGCFLGGIFSKLPDGITEWVYVGKNCCFIIAPDEENTKALYAAREDLRPHIAILPCDFLKRLGTNHKESVRTLLHEVAHGYLNHRGTASPEAEKEQDLQADKLADEWLASL